MDTGAVAVKITGLDALQRQLKELERALRDLDGGIANVRFDPDDPGSIERAIQQLNDAIDEKVRPYGRNDIVQSIAEELKESGRAKILERAAAARIAGDLSDDD